MLNFLPVNHGKLNTMYILYNYPTCEAKTCDVLTRFRYFLNMRMRTQISCGLHSWDGYKANWVGQSLRVILNSNSEIHLPNQRSVQQKCQRQTREQQVPKGNLFHRYTKMHTNTWQKPTNNRWIHFQNCQFNRHHRSTSSRCNWWRRTGKSSKCSPPHCGGLPWQGNAEEEVQDARQRHSILVVHC